MSIEETEAATEVSPVLQEGVVRDERAAGGKKFTLAPIPEWPNCKVVLTRVSEARRNQIFDDLKVNFVGQKPLNVKLAKATRQIQAESFVEISGWRDGNAPKGADGLFPLRPSTVENWIAVARHAFQFEGERTTVWLRCEALIDEELDDVTGN